MKTKSAASHREPNTALKASTNFLAGAVGGAGSTALIHPLDSLKVKMQTFPTLYRGGVHCVREVVRQEGVRGLYRGLVPAVTLSMTEASIRFGTYGVCQDFVKRLVGVTSAERMTLKHNAMAGGLTGFLATFVGCPIELIKCRMQGMLEMTGKADSTNRAITFRGPGAVLGHILRTEGIRGLYHGFSSNVARNVPGELILFATYEQSRALMRRPGQVKDDIGALGSCLCGASAGTMYWLSVYPLDCIKSRVQIMSAQGKVQGPVPTFLKVVRTEGVRALYHGVGYSIPRAMLGSGSHFLLYETTRKTLLNKDRTGLSTADTDTV